MSQKPVIPIELPSCLSRDSHTLLPSLPAALPNLTRRMVRLPHQKIPNTDTSKKGNSGETPLQAEKTLADYIYR